MKSSKAVSFLLALSLVLSFSSCENSDPNAISSQGWVLDDISIDQTYKQANGWQPSHYGTKAEFKAQTGKCTLDDIGMKLTYDQAGKLNIVVSNNCSDASYSQQHLIDGSGTYFPSIFMISYGNGDQYTAEWLDSGRTRLRTTRRITPNQTIEPIWRVTYSDDKMIWQLCNPDTRELQYDFKIIWRKGCFSGGCI